MSFVIPDKNRVINGINEGMSPISHYPFWTLSDLQLKIAVEHKCLRHKGISFCWGKITHFKIDRFLTGFEHFVTTFVLFLTKIEHLLTTFLKSSFLSEKRTFEKSNQNRKIINFCTYLVSRRSYLVKRIQ